MHTFILALATALLVRAGAVWAQPAATVGEVSTPPGYERIIRAGDELSRSIRSVKLVAAGEFTSGDGGTLLCEETVLARTPLEPYDNSRDVGVDGIVRFWGDYLWSNARRSDISFPLDNGQIARWSDWAGGLRPKKSGGRFVFTQVTTPDQSRANFDRYLSFVAEEMGAIALRRETQPVIDDSIQVGDLLVALRNERDSAVGIVLDLCRNPKGERLIILGTSGTPSTTLYLPRPFSPVQGVGDWHTLDGARWEIGRGAKTELRRIRLQL